MTEAIIAMPAGPTFEGKPGTEADQARERSIAKRAAARNSAPGGRRSAGNAAPKAPEPVEISDNLSITQNADGTISLTFDPRERLYDTQSGKAVIVATTEGWSKVPGMREVSVTLCATARKPRN